MSKSVIIGHFLIKGPRLVGLIYKLLILII